MMATRSRRGNGRFDTLSEELLCLIVDALYESDDLRRGARLKNLRLVSRLFAYSPRIQVKLFREIVLEPSPWGLQSLEKAPLDRLKHYIRAVIVTPPQDSPLVGPALFREIVITTKIQRHALINNVKDQLARNDGAGHAIEQRWDVDPPFTQTELESAYRDYRQEALDAQEAISNGSVHDAWVTALKSLSRLEKVSIGAWVLNTSHYFIYHPDPSACWAGVGHPHDKVHFSDKCHKAAVVAGDALMHLASGVLRSADIRFNEVCINAPLTETCAWNNANDVQPLDLSGTKILRWNPEIFPSEGHSQIYTDRVCATRHWASTDAVGRVQAKALNDLLATCSETLQVLQIGIYQHTLMCWPPPDAIELSNLRELEFGKTIEAATFSGWIKKCTRLQRLCFTTRFCRVDGDNNDWRLILNAIRDHANRIRLVFDDVLIEQHPASVIHINLDHSTADQYTQPAGDGVEGSIARSIALYVSKRGGWDESLSQTFTGWPH